jgi:hypothetical protein
MSNRLNGAYWKLWHDAQSRFLIALAMVGLVILGVFTPAVGLRRPTPCVPVNSDLSWTQMRAEIIKEQTTPHRFTARESVLDKIRQSQSFPWAAAMMPYGLPNSLQIEDANFLSAHCAANERPNLGYAAMVEEFVAHTGETGWGTMVYVFLFIGILLSVGPPFSGESMEAFSLTFSLPWSREKWLMHRVAMSIIMLCILALIAVVAMKLCTHFPYMSHMKGGYPKDAIDARLAGGPSGWWVLLAGLVGISLGTVASLFSRNVLTAATFACLAAYLLVSVRFPVPDRYGASSEFLPIIVNGTAVTAFLVIGIAALLVSTRLRTTDF